MKKISFFICVILMKLVLAACGSQSNPSGSTGPDSSDSQPADTKKPEQSESSPSDAGTEGSDILVVYFSATGTTKSLAEYAADAMYADLYEIIPEDPYTSEDLDYSDNNSRSSREQNNEDARPAITGHVENMEQYETVFLGYPIWWGEAPRIINTFLEAYDFSGKTIVPFCTSGSSGIGRSAQNLHDLTASDVEWLNGERLNSNSTRDDMVSWLGGLNLDVVAE